MMPISCLGLLEVTADTLAPRYVAHSCSFFFEIKLFFPGVPIERKRRENVV